MSTTTENCIEFERKTIVQSLEKAHTAFVSYFSESKNLSYCGFLELSRDTISASLTSLPVSSLILDKWQSIDILWYNHFLDEAKKILVSKVFVTVKQKVRLFFYFAK
jgi:hypothetical protein